MSNRKPLVFAFTAIVAVAAFATAGGPLEVGSSAQLTDHAMQSIDGSMVSYNDVKGEKGTLVIFSCNHCPYVKGWETRLAAIGNWAEENGIGVLYINSNDPEAFPEDSFDMMKQRAAERGFKFHYVVDAGSKMAKTYGATKTPEVFLFNASDELVYYGTVDDNMRNADDVESPWLKEAVKAVANGEAPKVQKTKALGCSIKYYESTE